MDYMDLGVKSRKTGLKVKDDIKKDEYNMENVDDFFNDEDSGMITIRRKRRKSSILPSKQQKTLPFIPPELNISQLSSPHIFSPAIENSRRSSLLNHDLNTNNKRSESKPKQLLPEIEEYSNQKYDEIPSLDIIQEEDELSPVNSRFNFISRENDNNKNNRLIDRYETSYDLDESRINYREKEEKESINRTTYNPYTDIPDLVHDADTTVENTSFNTSDNAILEEEISEYEVDSEVEDNDYNSDLLSSGSSSSSDIDSDEIELPTVLEGNDESARYNGVDTTYIPSEEDEYYKADEEQRPSQRDALSYEHGYISSDNDDEYIPSQLRNTQSDNTPGIRISTRIKIPPLDYWRNEKVVFKRKSSKPVLDIEKIITHEYENDEEVKEMPQPKRRNQTNSISNVQNNTISGSQPRPIKRGVQNNRKSTLVSANTDIMRKIEDNQIIEAEWLKDGIYKGRINASLEKQSDEIIAYAPDVSQAERTKESQNEKYKLAVMFDKHKDHFASGMLKLPFHGKRDLTDSHNAFITFFVVQGVIEVTVAENKFITTEGCSFQVPSFNNYSFVNKGIDEAKMFFVQVIVPESFDSQRDDRITESTDESSDNDSLASSPESSSIVNLKNRHIDDTDTSIRPSTVPRRLFINDTNSSLIVDSD